MKIFLLLLVIILCVNVLGYNVKNYCGARNGGCDQNCDPKTGSCNCQWGWKLASNGKSCTHRNVIECKEKAGGNINELDLHNCLRKRHEDTKPLVWDKALAKSAADRAKMMVEKGTFHQSFSQGGMSIDRVISEKPFKNPKNNAMEKMLHWYSGIRKMSFRLKEKSTGKEREFFTQMVWKSTKKLGCGYGVSKDGKRVVMCCKYSPGGNYNGEFGKNVGNVIKSDKKAFVKPI